MKKIYYIYREYYAKSKILLFSYILLSFLTYGIIIAFPLVFAKIIDSAVYFEGIGIFFKFIFLALILQICHSTIIPIKHYVEYKIQAEATAEQMKKIISRIPVLQFEAHKSTSIGQLIQLIDNDLSSAESLVISDFVEFLNQTIFFIVIFIIVSNINTTLSFVLLGILLPMIIISKIMIPKIQKSYQDYIVKSEEVKDLTDDIYAGSLTIKMANVYNFINNKVNILVTETKKVLMKYYKHTIIHYHFLTGSFMNIGQLVLTGLGAYMVIQGEITVGSITILGGYFGSLWGTFDFFMNFWKNFKEKMVSVDRVVNYLKLPNDPDEGIVAEEITTIQMSGVSYQLASQNILMDISFELHKGDKILLTGDNGSGKSTFVRLLVGLISPTDGSIKYNGNDIFYYNLHSIRERVNYIPAEPYIFSGSLEDNFFDKTVVCGMINAEKYVDITKNGSNLSSGEKKRLQLAVGMQQKSDIYILDEPLNFVDEVSKKEIIETIKREFADKTLIIISHESSPFDFCGSKYFMENGRLRRL